MARSLRSSAKFVGHVLRDVAGSLRRRWSRWRRRVVDGDEGVVVGVDVYPFFERMTGVGWYAWNLLASLDRVDAGLECNLYGPTFLAPQDPAPPAMPGTTTMRLRTHHLPADFLLPHGATLSLLRHVVEPLLKLLDANDVLFAPNFFLHRDQLPFGPTCVATVHDLAFRARPDTVAPETLAELERRLPETLFRCERLIAVSESTADGLEEYLDVSRRRVHTIHEGLDPAFGAGTGSTPTLDDDAIPYLLFVSTLEPRKNVTGVLRAFRLLAEWGYPGRLVLVGRWGWRTESIRAELESSPVRDRIVHLDYVERNRLPSLYAQADALLFPSWIEGFGLPILEAMACGTPVVTSGSSSMPEVAGPAAVYVDPSSPHGIASAVSALLDDEHHRARLITLGRERVQRFSWDRAAAVTAEVLRQAAGMPPRGADEYRV
jgi:glycosyltransferase involved in cell wall biosynthesis